MPEYVKHIRHSHAERKREAWCGQPLDLSVWAFLELDHAAYNNLDEGRLLSCPACVEAACAALRMGGEADGG